MSIEYLQDPLTRDVMQVIIASVKAVPPYPEKYFPKLESLPISNSKLLPSVEQALELELKPLPEHLKYIYLGERETLLVNKAADLLPEEDAKLVECCKGTRKQLDGASLISRA